MHTTPGALVSREHAHGLMFGWFGVRRADLMARDLWRRLGMDRKRRHDPRPDRP